MSRELFKTWGADLTPEDFSVALAGLAKFGPLTQVLSDNLIKTKAALRRKLASPHIVEVSLTNIAKGVRLIANDGQLIPAPDYLHLWRNFVKNLAADESICIELDTALKVEFHSFAPDVFWALRELQRPGGAAASAYMQSKHKELPVAFELPWSFGVLDDQESRQMAEIIRHNNWQHLFEVVKPEASNLKCGMLILPFDLPTARSRLLKLREKRFHIEADSVIVMRGIGEPDTGQSLKLASSIQDSVKTSGLNIVSVPVERDSDWMNQLVLQLSHDTPLVNALPMIQVIVSPPAQGKDAAANIPIQFASRNLVHAASARSFAKRLEQAVRSSGPQFVKEADLLAKHISAGKWQSELGEATEIVNTRQQIELASGEIKIPRFGETFAHAKPPLMAPLGYSALASAPKSTLSTDDVLDLGSTLDLPSGARPDSGAADRPNDIARAMQPPEPDQRRVLIDLYDVTDIEKRHKVKERLFTNKRYKIELSIAAMRDATVVAGGTFPRDKLPPGNNVLNVHFVPLVRGENGEPLPSQHTTLLLPNTADSDACRFGFDVPPKIETYRARFIISYHNRVLQTLILSAPVGSTEGKFVLDVENIVDPSFDGLSERQNFDAAILVNDSPNGDTGLIAVQGNIAIFTESEGLKTISKSLRDLILNKAASPKPKRKYDGNKGLLNDLSRLGHCLWNILPDDAKKIFQGTTARIQIVDVRIGAYFPAEFVHPAPSPQKGAELCPNGEKSLAKGQCLDKLHGQCARENDDNFICPVRMWGLGMVIERQPATGGPADGFVVRDLTSRNGKVLSNIFDHVIVSVSNKVTDAGGPAMNNLVALLKKSVGATGEVSQAKDWTELKSIVHRKPPTLLILIPHSGADEYIPDIPALELGGEWLSYDHFKGVEILGAGSSSSIVLLLGCDTNNPEVPFMNFIKPFKDSGAAMVIGTVTQIEAKRTVAFVERFITAITSAGSTTSFGEVLLQTRRNMLAKGDGYALSLLAYGDSDQ